MRQDFGHGQSRFAYRKTRLGKNPCAQPGNPSPAPAPNSHTASPTTTVSITYDEPISATTVTSRTFAIHGMQSGLVTETHGVINGNTIIVTPTHAFHQGELVYAIATTRTTNITGTAPVSATQWQFNAGLVSNRCVGGFSEVYAGSLTRVFACSVAWGDYDNDGDLDILLTGTSSGGRITRVYRNEDCADLVISKAVTPAIAAPGDTITYTLSFSNAGGSPAAGVVITDIVPISLTHASLSYTYTGALITPTGGISYVWDVEDLSIGEWGVITISGQLSNPLAVGGFSNTATVTLIEADADNNSSDAGVTVVAPEITVNPPSLPFGNQDVDAGATLSQTVTITNDGSADLHISAVTPTGDTGEFNLADSGEATLTPGDTRTIEVSFDPFSVGAKAVTLTIESDDSSEPSVDVTLSGTGVTQPAMTPPVLVSPADGTLTRTTSLTLIWQAATSATGYWLDWNGTVSDTGNVTEYATGVLADGTYTWTVAAYDALSNTSAYTDVWAFIVDTTAPTVTLVSPTDGATDVLRNAPIVVDFSEAMATGSVSYTIAPTATGLAPFWEDSNRRLRLTRDEGEIVLRCRTDVLFGQHRLRKLPSTYRCCSTIRSIWLNLVSISLTILNWVRHLSRLWFSRWILKYTSPFR